jgi:hypothetical protein
MCEHPRDKWVGTAAGITCGVCGALVGASKPAPVKAAEPKEEKIEPKKAAPKKGGKK